MDTELEQLAEAARSLAVAAAHGDELATRAERPQDRLGRGRFNVSVLGEFKRGKSTLVNAPLGLELMPTGVLPLTAVATEVAYGPPGATDVHLDGVSEEVDLAHLADYVTEAGNPGNGRQVSRAEVRAPAELLRPGVVLVDTPGIGSVFCHDEAAARPLLDADGAILALSADAPLSEEERKLLGALSERGAPTSFVLNRADHLSQAELDEVSRFVSGALAAEPGREERPWRVSAPAALGARLVGDVTDEDEGGEFAAWARSSPSSALPPARNSIAYLAEQGSRASAGPLTQSGGTIARRVSRAPSRHPAPSDWAPALGIPRCENCSSDITI